MKSIENRRAYREEPEDSDLLILAVRQPAAFDFGDSSALRRTTQSATLDVSWEELAAKS